MMQRVLLVVAAVGTMLAGCTPVGGDAPGGAPADAARKDILIADFEGTTYGEGWKVEGEAFGSGPARGTLPHQAKVFGFRGKGLVNTFFKRDASTGTLTSPPFTIERKYINFLIGGGGFAGTTCMNLLIGGKAVLTATGPNTVGGSGEVLAWKTWDVAKFAGRKAAVRIVDKRSGGWGHINVDQIVQSDIKKDVPYGEQYRPQFHFTAPKNWINDPNGLIYYDGEYHLMYQYNREGRGPHWATKGLGAWWGHAVSTDLVHWKHLPVTSIHASSGSGVVDRGNTSGLGEGKEDVLVAFYGGWLSYSRDRGRTWTPYKGNPVLPKHADPYVFRHEPTKRWILVSFIWPDKPHEFLFYKSTNLRDWTRTSVYAGKLRECPSLFELPVEGEDARKWIFHSGNGEYVIGTFDGERVREEAGKFRLDWGDFYASQCWSGRPPGDDRTIQIAWMINGWFPGMPFNQQLTFPCELTLRRLPEGLRVCRQPVREIARLYERVVVKRDDAVLKPGEDLLEGVEGELFDIELEADLKAPARLVLTLRGERIVYDAATGKLHCGPKSAPFKLRGGRFRLRALLDRASIELFAGQGQVALTRNVLPKPENRKLTLGIEGGTARVRRLRVRALRSAWRDRPPE